MNGGRSWLPWLLGAQVAVVVLLVAYSIWSQTLPGLMWTLHSSDGQRRALAAKKLGEMGPAAQQALPALRDALDDDTTAAQFAAATAIQRIGGLPALAEAVKSPNPQARAQALGALRSVPRGSATDAQRMELLTASLHDSAPQVRQLAVRMLGEMGPAAAPALPQISALLYDPDSSVRVAAVGTLDRLGSLEDLAKAISSSDGDVRRAALAGLPRYGTQAIPVLTAALQSEDPRLVAQAADMLASMNPPATSAVPALAHELGRPDVWLRMRLLADLERIGGPDAEAVVEQATSDSDAYFRNAALAALQRMKQRSAP